MLSRCSFTLNSASTYSPVWLVLIGLLVPIPPLQADVCVWRDPERTMQRIFPNARDYRTVTVKMTPGSIAAIERLLGEPLDESEKVEFNFYEVVGEVEGKPKTIGTIMALAGKGEYGAIEVVIGVNNNGAVVGAYIQRSRERVTRALQSPEFLKQFVGKRKDDGFAVGAEIRPASPEAESASRIVAFVIKKMLIFYEVLASGGEQR